MLRGMQFAIWPRGSFAVSSRTFAWSKICYGKERCPIHCAAGHPRMSECLHQRIQPGSTGEPPGQDWLPRRSSGCNRAAAEDQFDRLKREHKWPVKNDEKKIVKRIQEADYGCDERPKGGEDGGHPYAGCSLLWLWRKMVISSQPPLSGIHWKLSNYKMLMYSPARSLSDAACVRHGR